MLLAQTFVVGSNPLCPTHLHTKDLLSACIKWLATLLLPCCWMPPMFNADAPYLASPTHTHGTQADRSRDLCGCQPWDPYIIENTCCLDLHERHVDCKATARRLCAACVRGRGRRKPSLTLRSGWPLGPRRGHAAETGGAAPWQALFAYPLLATHTPRVFRRIFFLLADGGTAT